VISVITSVYKKAVFDDFAKNLQETIGVPYELVSIDNSKGEMGLCEVYNKGAAQARFDILCYAHEDILINTPDWGSKVTALFGSMPELGLLGVAGCSYKPLIPSGWSFPFSLEAAMHTNYIQTIKEPVRRSYPSYYNPDNQAVSRVVSVDGMWFCTRRSVAREIRFDDRTFKRFHCYDVDYSLAVYQRYQVAVTSGIQVEHFSQGSFGEEWVRETLKLHRKWAKVLPINLAGFDAATRRSQELGAFYYFLSVFTTTKVPAGRFIVCLLSPKLLGLLGAKLYVKLPMKVIKDRLFASKK
jgi:hypothetical protein